MIQFKQILSRPLEFKLKLPLNLLIIISVDPPPPPSKRSHSVSSAFYYLSYQKVVLLVFFVIILDVSCVMMGEGAGLHSIVWSYKRGSRTGVGEQNG